MREMVGGCCVCSDDRGWPENPLVYCDGQSCTVAVHQACYGIVTVPTGPWYCRKCESQERAARVKCELCPSRDGALKRTDSAGWAHVVCALYIPEVRFGNVTTMEPIILQLIPPERYNRSCYICEEVGKASRSSVGACMQCNKSGCKQQFHVTCAQALGLLCEEAGNYLDNVKYCGYCQHHYSKLVSQRKGGNVKTIPPYKPIPADNHSSDSSPEKEADLNSPAVKTIAPPTSSSSLNSSGKRKSSSGSKSTSSSSSSSTAKSSTTNSNTKSGSSSSKAVHNSSSSSGTKNVDKSSSKSVSSSSNSKSLTKSDIDSVLTNHSITNDTTSDVNKSSIAAIEIVLDHKSDSNLSSGSAKSSSKKRKANSRTPTPNSTSVVQIVPSADIKTDIEVKSSVVVSVGLTTVGGINTVSNPTSTVERRDSVNSAESGPEKTKKAKTEHATSTSTIITAPSLPVASQTGISSDNPSTVSSAATTNVIQSPHAVNSLVVSVPLSSTALSPTLNPTAKQHVASTPNNVIPSVAPPSAFNPGSLLLQTQQQERSGRNTPASGNSTPSLVPNNQGLVNNDMSGGGGLKITYEKQPGAMEMEAPQIQSLIDAPTKRSRSQSTDKPEKQTRTKKRGPNGAQNAVGVAAANKRSSRSQHSTPPPTASSSFANISQSQIKDSPPSSPNSETASAPVGRKSKGRKNNNASSTNARDTKDIKLFQNGIHAPHMLGNQLNPNSNMAQKMSDHLNSELEAHSIFTQNEVAGGLVGPQLHTRASASARCSSSGGSSSSAGSGSISSMLGGAGGAIPQTLDQLLERQWEQGSQFLMEQAHHFDIASLLSCLYQLTAENSRIEERVSSLLQRRDHLLAVNARLAIPLTGQPGTSATQQVVQPGHPHTVNNIHPSVSATPSHVEPQSRSRHSYPPQGQPIENGLPADSNSGYPHQHRSPANSQPSPIRHSPVVTGYSGNAAMVRQPSGPESGRSAPRPQAYPQYPGPNVSTHQPPPQMVIRRESDHHHQLPSSKPS